MHRVQVCMVSLTSPQFSHMRWFCTTTAVLTHALVLHGGVFPSMEVIDVGFSGGFGNLLTVRVLRIWQCVQPTSVGYTAQGAGARRASSLRHTHKTIPRGRSRLNCEVQVKKHCDGPAAACALALVPHVGERHTRGALVLGSQGGALCGAGTRSETAAPAHDLCSCSGTRTASRGRPQRRWGHGSGQRECLLPRHGTACALHCWCPN